MNCYFLFTASGPLILLTSFDSITSPELLNKLDAKGIHKFVGSKVDLESAKEKYGHHFDVVCSDLHESDDLRVLDYNGNSAFSKFKFSELGDPVYHEGS